MKHYYLVTYIYYNHNTKYTYNNDIILHYNNNKQCVEFDLDTAPWTSIYIII